MTMTTMLQFRLLLLLLLLLFDDDDDVVVAVVVAVVVTVLLCIHQLVYDEVFSWCYRRF